MTRRAAWTLAALVAGLVSICSPSWADERPLVLEMVLNGRATGILGNFTDRGGTLYATPAELSDLGFSIPATLSGSSDSVDVNAIPGIEAVVNERMQTVVIRATDAVLRPQQLNGPRDFRQNAAVTKPMTGLVLNYDVLATYANGLTSGGAEIDTRFFSTYGIDHCSGIVRADRRRACRCQAGIELELRRTGLTAPLESRRPDHRWT